MFTGTQGAFSQAVSAVKIPEISLKVFERQVGMPWSLNSRKEWEGEGLHFLCMFTRRSINHRKTVGVADKLFEWQQEISCPKPGFRKAQSAKE